MMMNDDMVYDDDDMVYDDDDMKYDDDDMTQGSHLVFVLCSSSLAFWFAMQVLTRGL